MTIILKQLTILYLFFFAGWLIGKLKKDKAAHADILSVLLVNVLLPCKIFLTFANNTSPAYLAQHALLLPASLVLLLVLAVAAHFVSKLLTKRPYERRVYTYSFTIANYAYLGYALIENTLGEAVLARFMFFAIPFILYTYTAGYVLLTGGQKPLKRLLNPITVSIFLGILAGLAGLRLPEILTSAASTASACVGPLSMLLTGITLSTFALRELLADKTAYLFSFLRLVAIPGVTYLICRVAHLDAILPMALIITCMPCGLNTIVFPRLVGEDCKPGARLALITHVFSLATLPFWLSLIK